MGSPNDADVVAQRWSQYLTNGDFDSARQMLYPDTQDPSTGEPILSALQLSGLPGLVDRFRPGASPDTVIHGAPTGHVHWVAASTHSSDVEQTTLVLLVDDRAGSRSLLTDIQVVKTLDSGVEQIDLDPGAAGLRFASPTPGPLVSGDVPAPLTYTQDSAGYVVVGAPVMVAWAEWLPPGGSNQRGVARFSQSHQRGPALLVAVVYTHGAFLYAVTPVVIMQSAAGTPAPQPSPSRAGPTLLYG